MVAKKKRKKMDGFELAVKQELVRRNMTQAALASLIRADIGIRCEKSYLSDVIKGKRTSAPVRNSIRKILRLEE